ncbi:DUF6456 domain-containing protein [Shimia sediminis]|uniref:DUF6456 domain-containing protein n=1 Tax=Shimia sediminis TaxID=2497945 RepID=UPI000F8C69D9|nr:DUF6456 domain-containing protein [Shimia sediminis]
MAAIDQHIAVRDWVPEAAKRYLLHTEQGLSIRKIARQQHCHPSTVLRQVRKFEGLRDDPLMDEALSRLSPLFLRPTHQKQNKESASMVVEKTEMDQLPDAETLKREALRILRRLCETGAVLAVAQDMERAVVVREAEGATARTGVVDRAVAQAMVLKDWISCDNPGRISRYRITAAGRSELNKLLAETENQAQGFAEAQAGFDACESGPVVTSTGRAMRFSMADSPLTALARRRDRDGSPFLNEFLVAAGERLREDFELAQMGPRDSRNWKKFLSGEDRLGYVTDLGVSGPSAMARERVAQAVRELGEGLADVALRCCCFLEGLESAEKRLGWSARSGKIVLRIALIRLSEYYRSQAGGAGRMIG